MPYKKRIFLNKDQTKSAHIVAYVNKTNIGREGQMWGCEATFEIMDCYRKISLDFGIYDKKTVKTSIDKGELILKLLTEFLEALKKEADFIATYEEPKKKDEDKKKKDEGPLWELTKEVH